MTENFAIKDAITNGEMVTKASLDKLIQSNILQLMNKRGIIIDGFPRDMVQIEEFQDKVSTDNAPHDAITSLFVYSTVQPESAHRPPRLFEASTWPGTIG